MKVVRIILILLCLPLTSCTKEDQNNNLQQADSINKETISKIVEKIPNMNWEDITDERKLDVIDSTVVYGPVKELKVWSIGDNIDDRKLILNIFYDKNNNCLKYRSYSHGEQIGFNNYFDDHDRLILRKQVSNDEELSEKQITYEYESYPNRNTEERKVYIDGIQTQLETKIIDVNSISLEIDYLDNKSIDEKFILTFKDNLILSYSHDFSKTLTAYKNFLYDNNRLIILELLDDSKKKYQEYHYIYDDLGFITESERINYRIDPPSIIRKLKITETDKFNNWLKREIYENDTLVSVSERELIFW